MTTLSDESTEQRCAIFISHGAFQTTCRQFTELGQAQTATQRFRFSLQVAHLTHTFVLPRLSMKSSVHILSRLPTSNCGGSPGYLTCCATKERKSRGTCSCDHHFHFRTWDLLMNRVIRSSLISMVTQYIDTHRSCMGYVKLWLRYDWVITGKETPTNRQYLVCHFYWTRSALWKCIVEKGENILQNKLFVRCTWNILMADMWLECMQLALFP